VTALRRIIAVEAKLFMRELGVSLSAIVLPTVILLVLGAIPATRRPDDQFGGQTFLDVFCPSLVVITIAVLAVNTMPIRFGSYREKGVLRRMSTTPVHPAYLLASQLVVNLAAAVTAVVLLVAVGRLAFGVSLPRHPLGFVAAFALGTAALFACGLLVAAVAPNSRAAGALAIPLYLLAMFFGGVYLPRFIMPEILIRFGDYSPPGVQALQDAWTGSGPNPVQLGIMAVITLVVGGLAARVFRWE
jgi:ABC-2 type transport system permease protein